MDLKNVIEADNDGLGDLLQFYRKSLPVLTTISLYTVPAHVIRDMAVIIHSTVLFETDWRSFANTLGIDDNLLLNKISASAKTSKELPLYIIFSGSGVYNKSFGNLVETLMHEERFDVLHHIKQYVQSLLDAKSITEVKEVECEIKKSTLNKYQPSYSSTKINCCTQKSSSISTSSYSFGNHTTPCFQGSSILENRESTSHIFENCSEKSKHLTQLHAQSTSERTESSVNVQPSAPINDILTVFILNTEDDSSFAEQLSTILGESGIITKSLSDIEHLCMIDLNESFSTIFYAVDFIVPIVSNSFLEQAHPRIYTKYIDTQSAMNTRCIYQLFMNEFRFNNYLNFRVKPVLVPEFDRSLLKYELILSSALRLWSEVPKLVKILRKTKELFPKYNIH